VPWALNIFRRQAWRVITKRLPRRVMMWWSKYVVPVFWVVDRIPVVRYGRYLLPVLIYKNYPRQRVFFDDRHLYFGEPIIQDYLKIGGGGKQWREALDRYRFNLVLCPADSALASLMKLQPDWMPVEDDGTAVLFRKTS